MYLVISVHIWFIVNFWFCRFFAGYFCVFWCNSLIINTIHFSGSLRVKLWLLKGMVAFSGNFFGEEWHTLGSVGSVARFVVMLWGIIY